MAEMFRVSKDYKKQNKATKLPIKFNITHANMIIGYLFKQSVQITIKSLKNLKKLFDIIDLNIYIDNDALYTRMRFIQDVLDARLNKGFENEDAILNYCMTDNPSQELQNIITAIPQYRKINYEEIKYINRMVQDRLTYSYILEHKDAIYSTMERIDSGEFKTYQEINDQFKSQCSAFLTAARRVKDIDDVKSLTLSDESFENNILDIVTDLKNPSKCYKTGIQCLNKALSPGLLSQRTYLFCGAPGGFKSGILLKLARDIKKYNKGVSTKTGKRPAILFVTMENTIKETVERMFNMSITSEDIRNYTPKQVLKMLKENGDFTIGDDENDIDIVMKYYGNREIDTSDLYTIIEEMADDNKECIALILDYIKRIKPTEKGKDEKEELKNITNELHNLAIDFDIPVISAMQINREGARALDAAMENNKADIGRFVGRGNIGSAWEIIENSDWVCMINVEKKKNTDHYYLTFKRVKIRYRDADDLGYFNHPFMDGNRMRLVDDIDLPNPISEESLQSDFEGVVEVDTKKGRRSAREREVVKDEEDIALASEVFNLGNMIA